MHKHHILIICLYCGWLYQVLGQAHENAVPNSAKENLPPVTRFEDLSFVDSPDCKKRKVSIRQFADDQYQFACPIYTDLGPGNSGQWTDTPSGRVWRLGIRSDNAYSLYLSMHYLLFPGAKMYVYGPEYQHLRGAFTSRNNNPAQILSIAPVSGDRLIIELNIPTSQLSFGELKITKVYHDYANLLKDADTQGRKSFIDGCGEDINCPNGQFWQTEKRAVCKIIANGSIGTGTLVGNTSGSSTPYVLSAYHVISSDEMAAEALFLFNYETASCGQGPTNTSQSLSGATLLATTDHQVDFTLMELYEEPPPSYHPFYAGWDARNIAPQSGVCIHLPFGESKQIAIDYHPVGSEDIGEGYDANSTWKISHWEVGTTKVGSSGAPLFNEQHRIIGTLTGGRASCNYPGDDYFTKFGVSWDAYPDPSNQLKHWLDPTQTGRLVADGYDPYGFNAEHCDTAWNFSTYDQTGLSSVGLSWGWATGHSSAGYTQFAERYESVGALQINGVYLDVAKAYSSDPLANIEMKVWEGAQYPEREYFSKLYFLRDLQPGEINYIAFDTVLTMSGPFFVGYKIHYNNVSDTFALYQAIDRGHTGFSSMYIYDGGWYPANDPNALGIATSLGIGISECYGKTHNPASEVLNVYPNPCSNSLKLNMPKGVPIYEVQCFDNSGRPRTVSLSQTEEGNMLFFNLQQGIYYLRIKTAEKTFAARFIVLEE